MTGNTKTYLLVGEDEFPLNAAAKQLVASLVPEADQAFRLETVDGDAATVDDAVACTGNCANALITPGLLMMQGKVVWWRDVAFLMDGPAARNETVRAKVRNLVDVLESDAMGQNILVITAARVDKRSALYRACVARGQVREFNVPDKAYLAEQQARERVRSEFRGQGLAADEQVLEAFLGRVGWDSRQIANETRKLSVFVGPRRTAGLRDVEAVVSSTSVSGVWDLLDAVGSRSPAKALESLRDLLARKESPIGIVSALAGRLRELLFYREALDKGWLRTTGGSGRKSGAEWTAVPPEADSFMSTAMKRDPRTQHPFYTGKLAMQARAYTGPQLRRNQRIVLEAHERLVSIGIPAATILEIMLVRLMS